MRVSLTGAVNQHMAHPLVHIHGENAFPFVAHRWRWYLIYIHRFQKWTFGNGCCHVMVVIVVKSSEFNTLSMISSSTVMLEGRVSFTIDLPSFEHPSLIL